MDWRGGKYVSKVPSGLWGSACQRKGCDEVALGGGARGRPPGRLASGRELPGKNSEGTPPSSGEAGGKDRAECGRCAEEACGRPGARRAARRRGQKPWGLPVALLTCACRIGPHCASAGSVGQVRAPRPAEVRTGSGTTVSRGEVGAGPQVSMPEKSRLLTPPLAVSPSKDSH